jgi:hypothetical protein
MPYHVPGYSSPTDWGSILGKNRAATVYLLVSVDPGEVLTMPEWLSRVLGPGRPEVTCEECFDSLGEYVELELARSDAEARLPGMEAHLEGCPACREEHDLLLAFVAADGR